jgi:hypothetical protein
MLQRPYRKLLEIGDNVYYLLTINDEDYIATESVLKFMTKKLLKRKPVVDELIQGVQLFRLSNVTKCFFKELTDMKFTETEDELQGKIKTYIVDDIELVRNNVKKFLTGALETKIRGIQEVLKAEKQENIDKVIQKERDQYLTTRFEFELDPKESKVVKALIDDGSEFLYKETFGVRTYEVILINRSTTGAVKFTKLYIYKDKKVKRVLSTATYVLDIDIINAYFNKKSDDFIREEKGGKK